MELTREGDVFVLTLKSGENRFHPDFMEELHRKLDEVERYCGATQRVAEAHCNAYTQSQGSERACNRSNGQDLEQWTGP